MINIHPFDKNEYIFKKILCKSTYSYVYLIEHIEKKEEYVLKILSIKNMIKTENSSIIINEIEINKYLNEHLNETLSLFLNPINDFYYDLEYIYMIQPFLKGGDLFYHFTKYDLKKNLQFYAVELLLTIEYLHNIGIIYKDIKLENICLDKNGHLCLIDFGLSIIKNKFYEKNNKKGTILYFCPELCKNKEFSFFVDLWAYGIILYELYYSKNPFFAKTNYNIFKNIINKEPVFCNKIDQDLKDLISKLLEKDLNKRLINISEIKEHNYFKDINWDLYKNKQINVPFNIINTNIEQNFENFGTLEKNNISNIQKYYEPYSDEEQIIYNNILNSLNNLKITS